MTQSSARRRNTNRVFRRALKSLALVGFSALAGALCAQVWEKPLLPGVTFRMEVQADPPRTLYGIKFAKDAPFWAESHLARKEIYDGSRLNGRDVVSAMVANSGAIGGVNGDFFQFGEDAGGDPLGLHVRNGEFLSAPAQGANRTESFGWGLKSPPEIRSTSWRGTVRLGERTVRLQGFNQRGGKNHAMLFTDACGEIYGEVPMTLVVVKADRPYRLRPVDTLGGTVLAVTRRDGRTKIQPGTFLVGFSGETEAAAAGVRVGDSARLEVSVTGFDWDRLDNAMSGGPVLVQSGAVTVKLETDPRQPRTAVGTTATGDVWYVVVDGRQPMSVGASLAETAQAMIGLGCTEAFNLDGGGSSAMNALGLTINRPSGGIERAVANAILWYGFADMGPERRIELTIPPEIRVGDRFEASLSVDGEVWTGDDPRAIWACQGAAWVDQAGGVRCHGAGKATLSVMIAGRRTTVEFNVLPQETAAGGRMRRTS